MFGTDFVNRPHVMPCGSVGTSYAAHRNRCTDRTIVFAVGQPTAGKGQLGRLLRRYFDIAWLPVGRLVRQLYTGRQDTVDYAATAAVVDGMVQQSLESGGRNLYIDGYPRTEQQLLCSTNLACHANVNAVLIRFGLTASEAEERCSIRRFCTNCSQIFHVNSILCPICGSALYQRVDDDSVSVTRKISQATEILRMLDVYGERFAQTMTIPSTFDAQSLAQSIGMLLQLPVNRTPIPDDFAGFHDTWRRVE
jgi:adenylate kinase family enzyme